MSEWHGIESAPKDGVESILIYTQEGVEMAWWSDGSNAWLTPCGKFTYGDNPTHWQPLPPPPPAA